MLMFCMWPHSCPHKPMPPYTCESAGDRCIHSLTKLATRLAQCGLAVQLTLHGRKQGTAKHRAVTNHMHMLTLEAYTAHHVNVRMPAKCAWVQRRVHIQRRVHVSGGCLCGDAQWHASTCEWLEAMCPPPAPSTCTCAHWVSMYVRQCSMA